MRSIVGLCSSRGDFQGRRGDGCRKFGCNAPVGIIYGINPFIIIFLVPVVGALFTRVQHFDMIHYGSYLSALAPFWLVAFPQGASAAPQCSPVSLHNFSCFHGMCPATACPASLGSVVLAARCVLLVWRRPGFLVRGSGLRPPWVEPGCLLMRPCQRGDMLIIITLLLTSCGVCCRVGSRCICGDAVAWGERLVSALVRPFYVYTCPIGCLVVWSVQTEECNAPDS